MFFSQEDYKKIQLWLQKNAIKDSELNEANLPLDSNEFITLVQHGHNVKIFLKDFVNQLSLISSPDLINVSSRFDKNYISLPQATQLVPYKSRKAGQIITFLNEDSKWKVYQFQGENINQWNNVTLWVDIA